MLWEVGLGAHDVRRYRPIGASPDRRPAPGAAGGARRSHRARLSPRRRGGELRRRSRASPAGAARDGRRDLGRDGPAVLGPAQVGRRSLSARRRRRRARRRCARPPRRGTSAVTSVAVRSRLAGGRHTWREVLANTWSALETSRSSAPGLSSVVATSAAGVRVAEGEGPRSLPAPVLGHPSGGSQPRVLSRSQGRPPERYWSMEAAWYSTLDSHTSGSRPYDQARQGEVDRR